MCKFHIPPNFVSAKNIHTRYNLCENKIEKLKKEDVSFFFDKLKGNWYYLYNAGH